MSLGRRRLAAGLLAAPLLGRTAFAQGSPPVGLAFSQVIELTGPRARTGDSWRNGVEMAVQEINAVGGVLGGLVEVTTFDAENGPSEVHRALEGGPLALLGPVGSSAARLAAPLARAARIAEITAADAPGLTAPEGTLFRSVPGLAVRIPRLVGWTRDSLAARRVSLVWANTEAGRPAHDALVHELSARGLALLSEHGVVPGAPADYTAEVAALAKAAPDAVLVTVPEGECVRLLREAHRQALRVPLVGESTLAAPRVLAAAGEAAEGVRCHLTFASESSEFAPFSARYRMGFKAAPDADAMGGYTAVGLLVGGVARLGRPDRTALPQVLRGLALPAGAPAMVMNTRWDASGEMTRATFMVEIKEGRPVVLATLN
jgi:branched-chain amino acid transport system substrate-binding protein